MIFTMTSKTYVKKFLNNETHKDILFSQYVLISSRIIRGSRSLLYQNIASFQGLYPPSNITMMSQDQIDQRYPIFLRGDEQMHLIANIVQTSLNSMNVIIMTSEIEEEIYHILKNVSNIITDTFKYPVYDYEEFFDGKVKVIPNDKKRDTVTNKICDKYIKDSVIEWFYRSMSDPAEREKCRRKIKAGEISKDTMKVILKKEDLYEKGMSKKDMRDAILAFC